jgi:predicted DCC family thiol-disulfide oxidoreductase YuxK
MARYTLVYDDKCNFCVWYSQALVKARLLTKANVFGFDKAPAEILQHIDFEKADVEIPLHDAQSHKVVYGADAIIELASNNKNILHSILTWKPLNKLLHVLYKLISYNRKGIKVSLAQGGTYQCMNSYSYNYKKFFIVSCYILALVCLHIFYPSTYQRAVAGLVFVSGIFALGAVMTGNKNYLEFVMQWQLQLFIIAVLLIPFSLLLPKLGLAALIYLLVVSVLFFQQINQRVKYLWWYWRSEK